jgi:hypothetical protein
VASLSQGINTNPVLVDLLRDSSRRTKVVSRVLGTSKTSRLTRRLLQLPLLIRSVTVICCSLGLTRYEDAGFQHFDDVAQCGPRLLISTLLRTSSGPWKSVPQNAMVIRDDLVN